MAKILVSGGAGGISARLDDMVTFADRLTELWQHQQKAAFLAGAALIDPDFVASSPLSPVTAAQAVVAITSAATKLTASAVETGVAVVFLRGSVTAYRVVDASLGAGLHAVQNVTGFVVGVSIGVAAVPVAITVLASDAIAGATEELAQSFEEAAADGAGNAGGLMGYLAIVGGAMARFGRDEMVDKAKKRLDDQLAWLAHTAQANPQAVEFLVGGAVGVAAGFDLRGRYSFRCHRVCRAECGHLNGHRCSVATTHR